ncbi:MAG: ABC transporter ATP-binding protein [candidate division Zixibacteria bacterium]|nr:ABC transporter ATP-binding protein [candidate division Zixibacteria bacterium]
MIKLQDVIKDYQTGKVSFRALNGVNLNISKGDYVGLVGPSGSGKSTLMNLIGCLDVPTSGKYFLEGDDVATFNNNKLADLRNTKIGFVFQAFNLLPYATAFENIEMPLIFSKTKGAARKKRIKELLELVGLSDKSNNKPTEMSGGEMQRVAIARALANEPDLILADEPTGNLDSKSGEAIVKIFDMLSKDGKTIMIITHDVNIAKHTNRIIYIKDGQIESNGHMPH